MKITEHDNGLSQSKDNKTQNYWGFGFCPLSSILETREHKVSETGFISVLR
jgi:hypothetical protein